MPANVPSDTKAALARHAAEGALKLAVELICAHLEPLSSDDPADYEAVQTILHELIREGDPFLSTFTRASADILSRGVRIARAKDADWSAVEDMKRIQRTKMREFGTYLANCYVQFVKFPDKAIRDKIRRALGS